jgi:hypothetical protein
MDNTQIYVEVRKQNSRLRHKRYLWAFYCQNCVQLCVSEVKCEGKLLLISRHYDLVSSGIVSDEISAQATDNTLGEKPALCHTYNLSCF